MRGFKNHSLHMLVLDEVLGLELSNFSRQLKLKPGIDDDHRVIVAMSRDLWFRGMEVKEGRERRENSKETRIHLEAMVLRTKPEANQWLHLTPRIAALGADAFEQGPVMIRTIHAYSVKELNLAENAEEKSAEFVNRVCHVTLEAFWTQKMRGEEGFDRTDSMLEGLGAGWTASFLAKVYPSLSGYLIKEFLQAVVEVSIVELLALFVTFGAEIFCERTSDTAHRRSAEFAARWTSDANCDNAWELGRTDEFDALPRAFERKCEEVRREARYGFLEHDKRFETYSYPVPPAVESLWNRRG